MGARDLSHPGVLFKNFAVQLLRGQALHSVRVRARVTIWGRVGVALRFAVEAYIPFAIRGRVKRSVGGVCV